MSAPAVRALVALGIVAGAVWVSVTTPARLGLDLRGGTQIVLETQDSATVKAGTESTDRAVEVLRRRVDALGVSEPSLTRSGDRRIIVELPGVQDPREAAEVIGRTAQLTFHPVLGIVAPDAPSGPGSPSPSPSPSAPADAAGEQVLPDENGQEIRLAPASLTGEGVDGAAAEIDAQGLADWYVSIDFRGSGGSAWKELTGTAACAPVGDPTRRVAIVLDDQVISSPQVDPSVPCEVGIPGGTTQITGTFTADEAKELAVLIRGGALPVPVEVIEQRTVGPTLGAAAIEASAKAAVIGVALTAMFITVMYRLLGGFAVVALGSYAVISYGALVALGATLTLPGLAGFVLAIGMAIDANVLVFERAREEYAAQRTKGLRPAVTAGFTKAWSAIIDSNVTTLLAGGLLFFLASGPVRGFGVTLAIGVLASMVSALVITRVLADWAVGRKAVARRPEVTGIAAPGRVRTWLTQRDPDLMRHGRRWLAGSGVVLVVALVGIGWRGLDLGVEFTGGRLVEYSTSSPLSVDDAREVVSDAGFPRAVVQESGADDLSVRTSDMTNDQEAELRAALAEASGGEVSKQRDELIGPSLGDELRQKALIALGVALGDADGLPRRAVPLDVRAVRGECDGARRDRPGGGLRVAGQADRRGLPGRSAHRHRLLGQRHGRGVRPGPRAVGLAAQAGVRAGRELRDPADRPADREHRSRCRVHPHGPGGARWRLAHGLRRRPAHRHRRGHLLLDVHRGSAGDRAREAQPVTTAAGPDADRGPAAGAAGQQRGGRLTTAPSPQSLGGS